MKKIVLSLLVVIAMCGAVEAKEVYEIRNVYSYDIVEGTNSKGENVIIRLRNMPRHNKKRAELVARLIGKNMYVDNYGIGYIEGETLEDYLTK